VAWRRAKVCWCRSPWRKRRRRCRKLWQPEWKARMLAHCPYNIITYITYMVDIYWIYIYNIRYSLSSNYIVNDDMWHKWTTNWQGMTIHPNY
jgi:hypothetical protein